LPKVNVPGAGVQNLPEEQASQYAYATERAHIKQQAGYTASHLAQYAIQPGEVRNPGGRPRGTTPGKVIRETVDPFKLVGILEEIASDPLERTNYRIDATVKLMEFGWGMAMTFAHVTTEDSTAVSLQAQYLEALRERLGLPAPTTVDGSVVHHNEAEPPQSPQPTTAAPPTKKRGRPRGAVDKQARKARTD